MKTLREYIEDARKRKVAIGHFNISDLAGLGGIFEAARELELPVIIGVSEGEREAVGTKNAADLVRNLREQYDYPIFINADHTHSLEKIKEAVEAGFDAVLFDAGKLSLEENIEKTKEVVAWVRATRPEVLIEAELGYIGSSSTIMTEVPEGAAVNKEELTDPEVAARFVRETGVDLLAPAVGNLHGMFKNAPNPDLDIDRIAALRDTAEVPMVLHGGSGIKNGDFIAAIQNGISIVHINTEIRLAWRKGMERALAEKPEEVTPYKLLLDSKDEVRRVVAERMRLFNGME
ncbi:MAG: Ketose-bisphosphate aldolase, class-II [Candidatus Wolfebacteria bacterium GW2011_GWE1_48_7]|uniref:Ketose-bisphosphate aldolase, class-II n=2 Tax=Candidatus Wolfeibacteriota TaxID=1752735 RepID=A0A0G1U663_9BACT|nr:MAG: Tagatose-bisphosphate aldolase, fructose-bisphosphate aldolase, class II [Candidatus Wolfebacteria bacterium GW2011_GWB1_47_1]KKU36440.1 MAG: Ketose-bisphosphate aldolase, class-II [Candidatus Wolfebacteria bacterium GW2011_GWC2_46_275]KKU41753.1 MAG: Ketose-bisphosphate aldolase, class-II [Candidatus Wolfebacteria bacterium GW2011_GWB2_46_69]KKU53953.1 MAG: Ketose-bisphosphate aldolase, class-II [Candidatus Wolfebacteria bacterium GW2011_GWC1_47_103]KKU59027.1 MAG: Ketose-bisphosphate 